MGTVPPSMTYSAPWIEAARSEAKKATSSATSSGHAGRPIGMPPSASMMPCRAACLSVPAFSTSRATSASAAVVLIQPGAMLLTLTPCGPSSFDSALL